METKHSFKDNIYLKLFVEFFTLGMFTFGGGAAMIAVLQNRLKDKKWLTDDEVLDCITVAQTLPGVVAVNMAIYVGYRMKRLRGAIVSVFGIVLPSFVIIILVALFLNSLEGNPYVLGALRGIRAATLGLILATCLKLSKQIIGKAREDKVQLVLTALLFPVSFLIITFLGLDAVWVILGGLVTGVVYAIIQMRREKA
ncbi:MAG: chromate transporter [Clostridia bacterium]|nr:chromate transporter [Clostridia bacterium]